MRVAADTRHPFEAKVKRSRRKSGPGEKRNEKRPQAAVDVERERFSKSKAGEGGHVINNAVGKRGGRADEEDCIAVD